MRKFMYGVAARLALLGMLAAVGLVVTACATRWHKPEVSLVNVELAGGTLFEQRLKLKLRVRNPNDRDIPIESLHFQLFVANKLVAEGQTGAPIIIPRYDDTVVDLAATMQLATLIHVLPEAKAGDGKLQYHLSGEVVVSSYGSIPFDHPGTLELGLLEGLGHKRGKDGKAGDI